MVIVKLNVKVFKICSMFDFDSFDKLFWRYSVFSGLQHDGCSMGIISANKVGFMTTIAKKPGPKVGLDVLNHMSDVYGAIGIG